MKIKLILFYISNVLAISLTNKIFNIIFLITSYVIGGLILISMGCSFIGIALILLYGGAILVFFLFIIIITGGGKEEDFNRQYFSSIMIIYLVSTFFFYQYFNVEENTELVNNINEKEILLRIEQIEELELSSENIEELVLIFDNIDFEKDFMTETLNMTNLHNLRISAIYNENPEIIILSGIFLFILVVGIIEMLKNKSEYLQYQISIEQMLKAKKEIWHRLN